MTTNINKNTLANLYRHTAKETKDRKLLLISPLSLTYGQTLNEIGRLMQCFLDAGLKKGDSIILSVEEDAVMVSLFLAAFRYGLPVTVIDINATNHEVKSLFLLVDAKVVVSSKVVHERWKKANIYDILDLKLHAYVDFDAGKKSIASLFNRSNKSMPEKIITFPAMLKSCGHLDVPPCEPNLDDDAVRFFTSGTTGTPKVVRLSYRAILTQADIMAQQTEIDNNSVLLSLFQFTQLGGLASGILLSFWNGATLCRPARKFSYNDIPLILDSIYNKRVTHFYLVPAMMDLFLRYGGDLKEAFDTDDFQYFLSMAATLPRSLWEEFEKVTGKEVINSYGLTEANNLTYSGPNDPKRNLTSIGRPINCKMKVVSSDNKALEAGGNGELLVKGATNFTDYYHNKEATDAVFKEGWLYTGDIGTFDSNGNFYITGRIKDVIISGGYNIYPEELNEHLRLHPYVHEAYTLGVKSNIWGEEVICCVVADKKQTNEQELINYLRSLLSQFKVPKHVVFLDEIPLTARGKFDRKEIERLISTTINKVGSKNGIDVKKQVIQVAAQAFFLKESTLQMASAYNNTPGWDSLGHLLFIESLENQFSIKFEPMEMLSIQTIADAIKIVEKKHETVT